MTEQNRRADDKRAPGQLQWGENGEGAAPAPERFSYEITPRAAHIGGGWRLQLLEDGKEVGGGVYPATEDVTSDDAYQEALSDGEAWLLSRGQVPPAAAAPASADNPSTAGGELETLRQENDKLREALGDSALAATMLHKLSVENGGINAVYSGGAAQILAEALGQQFIESGAENYLEVGFNTNTGVRLLVTLQRCDGKTPANFRAEAEEKLAAATADLEESRSRVRQLEEMLENRVERKPESTQEWAKVDGAIAFHLIDRHADSWHDVGNMMEAWRAANTLAAPVAQSTAGAAKGGITSGAVEEIAASWDGCRYDDMMIDDIGAALRADFARLATQSAKQGAQPVQAIVLPTWLQADAAVDAGRATPLDIFIHDQEPAGGDHESSFRAQLQVAIEHAAGIAAAPAASQAAPEQAEQVADIIMKLIGACVLNYHGSAMDGDEQEFSSEAHERAYLASEIRKVVPAAQVQADVRDIVIDAQADAVIGFAQSLADWGIASREQMDRVGEECASRLRAMKSKRAASTDGDQKGGV